MSLFSAPTQPPASIRVESQGPNQVRIQWQKPDESSWNCDSIHFEIFYRTDRQNEEKIQKIGGEQTEFVFPSSPHTQWNIKIRTANPVGTSPWSREFTIVTPQGAPGRIRNLEVFPLSPNDVRVSWQAPEESFGVIVGYDVAYRLIRQLACPTSAKSDWITIYNLKDLQYVLKGLLPYSEYEIKVAARTTEVGIFETKTITTQQRAPTASPLNLKPAYVLERSITYRWDPPPCEQQHGPISHYQYEIFGLDDWSKLDVRIANTTATELNVDGLIPFTKYRMRVKAFTNQGGGPITSDLDVQTLAADSPLPPQDLIVVSEGTDFIVVSWMQPYPPYGPLTNYKIRYGRLSPKADASQQPENWEIVEFRAEDPQLTCKELIELEEHRPRLCYRMTRLEPGFQYRIQVAAKIENGTYGPWSNQVAGFTLPEIPNAPGAITLLERTDTSLRISWQPPDDPLGQVIKYKILVQPLGTPGEPRIFTVDAPQTTFNIQNLEPETRYNLTVQAGTARGFGPGSSAIHATESGSKKR